MEKKKNYSLGEEIFSSVTHGVGAIASLIGGTVIVTLAAQTGDVTDVLSALAFGLGMVLMYTMSTLYHAFTNPTVKYVFKILDHCSIFILISATYTPFCLVLLKGNTSAFTVFLVLWGITIGGIVLKSVAIKKLGKITVALYVPMGWAAIWVIDDISAALSMTGLALLISGGLSYTLGTIFYSLKKIPYMHAVWHLFVVAGTLLHFLCIIMYVY